MRRLLWLVCSILLLARPASAYLFQEIHDIDDYVRLGQTIIVAECLPSDDEPVFADAFCRKVRVVDALRGEVKREQIFNVYVGRSLSPGNLYLIYSGDKLDPEGKLYALSYEPAVVQITLWGEISKAEKQKRVDNFLKQLVGASLKEKLMYILDQRVRDLKSEQQNLDAEKKNLQGLVPK